MVNNISFPNLGLNFSINRAAFSIGNVNIYWYGLIIALGMIIALAYGIREFKRCGLKQDDLLNMFLICVPVAIICARLYYVIFSFDQYRDNLLSIFDIRNGGIAVYGSLIGAGIVVLVYCLKKKINLGAVLDILAVGFLIGQAVGRWGNFVNAEAYGAITDLPWRMELLDLGIAVHPTFLYESLWNMGVFLIMVLRRKKMSFSGEAFLSYITLYGLGRFWIEGLRTDSLFLGPFRISQIVAVACVISGIVLIIVNKRKQKTLI